MEEEREVRPETAPVSRRAFLQLMSAAVPLFPLWPGLFERRPSDAGSWVLVDRPSWAGGAKGDGIADDAGALAAADRAGVATGSPGHVYRIARDLTLRHGWRPNGSLLRPDDSVTVRIAGPLLADAEWWMDITDGGVLVLGAGSFHHILPQWFGALADGQEDSTKALQASLDAAKRAGGGLVTIPSGVYRISDFLRIDGADGVHVSGRGATLLRAGHATSSFFQVVGSNRITLEGLTLKGEASAIIPSTGSNPPILVGSTDPAEERGNTDIEIAANTISGANWAGIVVYGRHGKFGVVKNVDIRIHNNKVTDSSMGIFVYKNARKIRILANSVDLCAQDCIAIDTRAASDRVASEPNFDVIIANNTVSRAGQLMQGIGILAKGSNQQVVIRDNVIRDVGPSTKHAVDDYGILVNQDFSQSGATDVTVTGNVIANVDSKGANGHGIYVGAYATKVVVSGNDISATRTNGIFVYKSSDVSITNNTLHDVTLVGGAGIRVDGDAKRPSRSVNISGNTIGRGRGQGATAIDVGPGSDASVTANTIADFPQKLVKH